MTVTFSKTYTPIDDKSGYESSFTGAKGIAERTIISICNKLIEKKKFDTIDNIFKHNEYSDSNFWKNNGGENVFQHYKIRFSSVELKQIAVNYNKMVDKTHQFSMENVNVKKFNDKEYIEYNGRVADNSYASKDIEKELKDMQLENTNYQSLDQNQNIDRMMEELFDEKKTEVQFNDVSSINNDKLNNDEQRLRDAALVQEYQTGERREISLENGLIKDEDNNISKINDENSDITIDNGNDEINETYRPSLLTEIDLSKLNSYEKDLYLATLNYQIETGETVRLDLYNKVIICDDDTVKDFTTNEDGEIVVNDERLLSFGENNELERGKVKVLTSSNNYKMYEDNVA